MAANDKKREFTITELKRTANGTFTELPAKFVWDHDTQSSPRNAWEFGLKLRTVREDYPGTNRPTEQVLGWNWEPFTLEGVWDDRYAGQGFAERTRHAFEALCQRGNLVRLNFEDVTITGLITHPSFKYFQKYRQGYSFQFSPHFREQEAGDTIAPRAVANPNDYAVQTQAVIDQAQAVHDEAPKTVLVGGIFALVDAVISDWQDKADTINTIVNNRALFVVPTADQPVNSVARLAQAFRDLASSASDMLPLVSDLPSDTSLFFQQGVGTLDLESWARGLGFYARMLIYHATLAADDLDARVAPDALALYRPHEGESLYAISNRFYGTPFRWRDIAERNRMRSIALTGAEVLIIPNKRGA